MLPIFHNTFSILFYIRYDSDKTVISTVKSRADIWSFLMSGNNSIAPIYISISNGQCKRNQYMEFVPINVKGHILYGIFLNI